MDKYYCGDCERSADCEHSAGEKCDKVYGYLVDSPYGYLIETKEEMVEGSGFEEDGRSV